jgi:dienelactone hydrolase
MRRLAIAGAILASALAAPALANDIELVKATIKAADGSEVPVEIATPAGKGPFPPVLFIHAKRGHEGDERAHVRELAAQGFLVVAPDWQSGRSASSASRAAPITRFGWPPSAAAMSPPSSATTATCRTPTRPNRISCSASPRRSC